MNFLKAILKKDNPLKSNQDFWNWFQKNEKIFFNVIKSHSNIEKNFFDKLSPKLNELREGYFFLTGMLNDSTAELIITADGKITNIVFVEELVAAAPKIDGWKFTAHKPSIDIKHVGIKMADYEFKADNLFFYSNEFPEYPDQIDITVVHENFNEENRSAITNGIFIFLDNFLGEIDFATGIDNLTFTSNGEAKKQLVPIEKLKSFLDWRQKEFVEKYDGVRHSTENDNYSSLEAELESGNMLVAIVNSDLIGWDRKASHPWILTVEMKFAKAVNGMPDESTYQMLNEVEDKIMEHLKDFEGYLNVARGTAEGARNVYFACREFRKPSKVLDQIKSEFSNQIEIVFDIYKDKYWQSLKRFSGVQN